MKLKYDRQQILDAIDAVVKKTMTMDMTWEWPCGVAYYGVCKAYEATKNQEYIDSLIKWVDEYIELGLTAWTVNTFDM